MWNEGPLLPLRHTQEIMIPFYSQGKKMEPQEYKSNVPKPTQKHPKGNGNLGASSSQNIGIFNR